MKAKLRYLIIKITDIHKIHVKLTGDGTQIARGLTIINVAFTVLEDGNQATLVLGKHFYVIVENYDNLAAALEDICNKGKQFKSIIIKR